MSDVVAHKSDARRLEQFVKNYQFALYESSTVLPSGACARGCLDTPVILLSVPGDFHQERNIMDLQWNQFFF